jgi:glycine cleavage system H protein
MSERDLKFTKTHEWLRVEGNEVVVGLSDYAQGELGDIVFVELPAIGTAVTKDESLTTLESVKSVSEVYAPVSGKITAVNGALDDDPGVINTDPYGNGWVFRIEMSDAGELEDLMSADEYERSIEG